MGNKTNDYEQNSDDFFFEDIVEDSAGEEEDEESYEQDFEIEQYLDGYREDFPEDFSEEDEEKVNPLVAVGLIVGLIVVAAIICAILWGVTHRGKPEAPSDIPGVENEDLPVGADGIGNTDGTSGTGESGLDSTGGTSGDEGDSMDGSQNQDGQEPADGQNAENGQEPIDGQQSDGVDDTDNLDSMEEPISGTTDMVFTEVSETVTAKDVTNVRTAPSTEDAYNIIGQLTNGETAQRTGVNSDTGWSRIEYEGQTAYAVTGYLTTDLNYKPPVAQNNPNRVSTLDGRTIIFVDCDDYITPKEYVNLRTEPSTSEGNATVSTQISAGTVVHRTGMSPDAGWSRLDVDGQVLYVVSSYMAAAEQTPQE